MTAVRRYRCALRAAISSEARAYGFMLVVWGTGGLVLSRRGSPIPLDVLAFVGGA